MLRNEKRPCSKLMVKLKFKPKIHNAPPTEGTQKLSESAVESQDLCFLMYAYNSSYEDWLLQGQEFYPDSG